MDRVVIKGFDKNSTRFVRDVAGVKDVRRPEGAKVEVMYIFNWVWALSSCSWWTIKAAMSERQSKVKESEVDI